MKIALLEPVGGGRPLFGCVAEDGRLVALDAVAAKAGIVLDPAFQSPLENDWTRCECLHKLAGLRIDRDLPGLDMRQWRFLPPVLRPGKIIATGRNYMDHVREGQELWAKRGKTVAIPTFPTAFAKYPSSLAAHEAPIVIPPGFDDVDYEIELAVVIGKAVRDVDEANALDCVAGYTICNDVGARGIQRKEMEQQIGIVLAKNFPTFAPMGPWLATADEIPDPQNLELRLTVDGDVRQHASTSDMIFPVRHLISYFSRMGLYPGDIIITGTPSGVALARENPAAYYLRPGQVVAVEIERIGTLRNTMAGG
jgi:2-keto-4-pentenoate hydratase/2-oxohepta-3-ene-1,7-dioic acid hydratase in catechol pathway